MNGAEPLESFLKGVWSETWDVFRRHALVFVLASVIVFLLSAVSFGIVAGPLFVGYIELVRRAERHEFVQASDVFRGFDKFWPSFLASIVIGIATCIGMFLLLVPGLLVLLFTPYTLQVIAVEGQGAFPAIARSARLVRDHLVNTLLLLVIISIAQSIGGTVVVGLLLTGPLSLIALTVAYERIAKQSLAETTFVAGTP